jgi:phosphatidylglycerol:prolipoprotein diacylglycerol transferase
MHPVLFTLAGTPVHSYGVMGAIGFLVVCFVALRRSFLMGLEKERVADVIFWTAIAGLVGSRALFVAQHPDLLPTWQDWVNIRAGGLVFYGALVTGLPVAGLLMWRYKLPFFALMDIFGTALPLGHAISRIGCFLAGCCYGKPTDGPLGVVYTDALTVAPRDVHLHPTQLYEAGALVLIWAATSWWYSRKRFDGQVMLLYLTLYAAARTTLELWRGDPERGFVWNAPWGLVSTSQAISAGVFVAALAVFLLVPRFLASQRQAAAT